MYNVHVTTDFFPHVWLTCRFALPDNWLQPRTGSDNIPALNAQCLPTIRISGNSKYANWHTLAANAISALCNYSTKIFFLACSSGLPPKSSLFFSRKKFAEVAPWPPSFTRDLPQVLSGELRPLQYFIQVSALCSFFARTSIVLLCPRRSFPFLPLRFFSFSSCAVPLREFWGYIFHVFFVAFNCLSQLEFRQIP